MSLIYPSGPQAKASQNNYYYDNQWRYICQPRPCQTSMWGMPKTSRKNTQSRTMRCLLLLSLGARKLKQDRQKQLRSPMAMSNMYEGEEFEDTKGVIRICKSKDRQHKRKKRDKRTNNDLQNIHIKLKTE